ncbi:uncharacterized protein N0V89_006211 [Didymosphaeria variabile]|uniref:DUF1772-domain-containing protein n=1 Tax=Didymosphaeria variabile TaxID=1932322 RepID=A0A9W9CC72_9PLEO|nr:uncharacterized protein N0V89_006211 [Didymosphaeria variabile]KAJ4354474.1 hypothetical protein N0V89_006211 [Didymosphaeria variabile]
MPSHTLPIIAIITGTFLSGASLSNSWFSLPILIKTLSPLNVGNKLQHFSLMQAYADPIFPLTAITTSLLHWTCSYRRWASDGGAWEGFAWAGAATFCMIPYSLVVVFPTVWKIEAVQRKVEKTESDGEDKWMDAEVEEARVLLQRWNAQHVVRGFMPLIGALIGVRALSGELGA